jgi:hypothetical protein
MDIGILFKPHPYDNNDYSDMKTNKHIILIDKYEDTYKLFPSADIHSTVYSTSGLEAIAFGIPNIFIDISNIIQQPAAPYIITSSNQFVESVQSILSSYQASILEMKALADFFYTPCPEKRFKQFFIDLGII